MLLALPSFFLLSSLYGDDSALDFQEELAFKQAVSRVAPSVIRIETVGGLDRIGEQILGNGPTTGLVVDADGWIMTSSFNFIGKPTSIIATLPDGSKVPAEIVATDSSCHLTLLKVDATGLPVPNASVPAERRIGQWTLAVGRSYPNREPSVSVGILSAVDRIHGKALQTDAKVSPVNYGGPLIDLQGKVLGLLVPLSPDGRDDLAGIEWYDSGIGFAIPLERMERILPRMQAGENLKPGLAGFSIRNPNKDGTTIERVRVGSPAFDAGLRPGDEILQVDGRNVRRDAQLRQALGAKYAGEAASIRFKREEQTSEIELTLIDELAPYEIPLIGVLLKKSTGKVSGVPVRAVIPDSPAAKVGIQQDDVIVGWNEKTIGDLAELKQHLYSTLPGNEVTLEIKRSQESEKLKLALGSGVDQHPVKGPMLRPASSPPKISINSVKVEDFRRDFWIMEPTDLPPNQVQTLIVWLHPPGKQLIPEMQAGWGPACDAQGIAMIGPVVEESRPWGVEDAEFLVELINRHREKYQLSRERVILYGGPGTGMFPFSLALKLSGSVGGVILSEAGVATPLPDLEPDMALRVCQLQSPAEKDATGGILDQVKRMKYPFAVIETAVGTELPSGSSLVQLIDWVDSTDRL